jgi:hypothetical protein
MKQVSFLVDDTSLGNEEIRELLFPRSKQDTSGP